MKVILSRRILFLSLFVSNMVCAEPMVNHFDIMEQSKKKLENDTEKATTNTIRELTWYEQVKAIVKKHKKRVIVGTVAAIIFTVLLWKHLHQVPNEISKQEDQTTSENSINSFITLKLQKGGVFFAPITKKTKLFYDEERKQIERGALLTKSSMVLTPELEKYSFKNCKVLPQQDCTSCGQRSLVNAFFVCKALQEGKNIDTELFVTQQEKDEYNARLQDVFEIKPADEATVSSDLYMIIDNNTKLKQELEARLTNPKVHEEQRIVDFSIMQNDKDGSYLLENILGREKSAHYFNNLINRFRKGVPQVFVISVTHNHWITLKFELKKDEKTGLLKPQVTCFDGKEFDYSNDPQINAILYLLTRGTEYQVGKLEQGRDIEEVSITQWTEGSIVRNLDYYSLTFPDEFKKEQKYYKTAKFLHDEQEEFASIRLNEIDAFLDLKNLKKQERAALLAKAKI